MPTSRPQSAMSQQSDRSAMSSASAMQPGTNPVLMRPRPPARKPRPSSIAVTGVGVSSDAIKLAKTPGEKTPLDKVFKIPLNDLIEAI